MKKLINDPANVVKEALQGVALAHADRVKVMTDPNVMVRVDAPVAGKVGLVSGGGSGTSRCTAASSGPGMLDAACPGEVFTSPTPGPDAGRDQGGRRRRRGAAHRQELHRRRAELRDGGRAGAADEGIEVEAVVINDDVAVTGQPLHRRPARRRGHGAGREDLRAPRPRSAGRWPRWSRPVPQGERQRPQHGDGAHLVHRAAAGKPTFELGEDEMEIGIGIHGEPGRERTVARARRRDRRDAATPIVDDLPFTAGDQVLAFVNGMGGDAADRALRRLRRARTSSWPAAGIQISAASSAPTSPRWRWPAARSRC